MIDIFQLILKVALLYIPRAIKKAEDREYVQKLISEALRHYEGRALDPATTRQASKDLDPVLEEKWRERWGSGSSPAGGRPADGA